MINSVERKEKLSLMSLSELNNIFQKFRDILEKSEKKGLTMHK